MDAFEAAYEKKIVPILKKHGLEESSERGRRPVEGVFSRLFEMETPSEVILKEHTLRRDPGWQKVLQSLGTIFGMDQTDGRIGTHFGLYKTPAGLGRTVEAGPGRSVKAGVGIRQGPWYMAQTQHLCHRGQ